MAKNRTAKEGTDIVQKKVDEEEANNAEIGNQFFSTFLINTFWKNAAVC